MAFPFNSSPRPTLGVEEEYQICDPQTGDLVPVAEELMEGADEDFREFLAYDLLLGLIEINTGVADSVGQAVSQLLDRRRRVQALAESLGCTLGMTGTHPTAEPMDQKLVQTQSYRWVAGQLRYVARRNITFGLHVHVGVDDGDRAVYVANRLRQWIGPLIALAANSPFLDGVDTGWDSSRCYAFGAFPRAGMPPYLEDWRDYEAQIQRYVDAGSIEKPRHVWWNVRAHPTYGTVEVRSCDVQSSLERTASLVALVQALVVTYAEAHRRGEPAPPMPRGDLDDGRWKGMRFGLDADVIDPVRGRVLSMREYVRQMLSEAEEAARHLGTLTYLQRIERVLEDGNGATRQRRLLHEHRGSIRDVHLEMLEIARREGIQDPEAVAG